MSPRLGKTNIGQNHSEELVCGLYYTLGENTRICKMVVANVSSSLNCSPGDDLVDFDTKIKIIYGLVGFNIFTSLLGILGNVLVFVAAFKTQGVPSNFQFLVTSLAVVDFTIALVVQPIFALLVLGRKSCNDLPSILFVFRLIGTFAVTMSGITTTLIALDRYLKVASAKLKYNNTMTMAEKVTMATAWVFACVSACLRVTLCGTTTLYFLATIHGLCFVIMIVCYTVTSYQVSKQRPFLSQMQATKEGADKEEEIKAQTGNKASEKQFARTIATVGLIVLAFLTGKILPHYHILTEPDKDYGLVFFTAVTSILSSSVANPPLYCFQNEKYRRTLKNVLPFLTAPKIERPKRDSQLSGLTT